MERIQGPLGLWPFRIMNRILEIVDIYREGGTSGTRHRSQSAPSTMTNKEEWEIIRGEAGELKNIIVHRDVKYD